MDTILEKIRIVMADDDPDDYYLVRDAFELTKFPADLHLVSDGEELMDCLFCRGKFVKNKHLSNPTLILLDLNMPRKDGWEVLAEIKATASLRRIPVIIFTTSKEEEDITRSYDLGASSYITKPSTFDSLIGLIETLRKYWIQTVTLPMPLQ